MSVSLFPKLYAASVYHINYEALYTAGFRGLVFDIDNTLAPFDIPEPDERLSEFFLELERIGFTVVFISNNSHTRVSRFAAALPVESLGKAKKPSTRALLNTLKRLNLKPNECALIGDQVFTDVLCANRAGLLSILVKPISTRDEWTVRIKRVPEKLVLALYKLYK